MFNHQVFSNCSINYTINKLLKSHLKWNQIKENEQNICVDKISDFNSKPEKRKKPGIPGASLNSCQFVCPISFYLNNWKANKSKEFLINLFLQMFLSNSFNLFWIHFAKISSRELFYCRLFLMVQRRSKNLLSANKSQTFELTQNIN